MGNQLLEVSHFNRESTPNRYKNTPFTFRVLDSPVVNAFALPGGYVYVTRGLLAHLENEAQLMVVLGHEIGHVAARHASQRAFEQQLGQVAIISGALIGQSFGLDGNNILALSSQTAQLLFLSYGRDDERESDAIGVEYSAITGYEAAEGAEFFTSLKRISEKRGTTIPTHLSSHPDPGEREQNIPIMAAEWEAKGYEQTVVGNETYLKMIDGMVFGENPRNGFERNGVFYHTDLKFQFPVPNGFELVNQSNAVILFNEKQDAIIQFTIDSNNSNPQASVDEFLNQEGIITVSKQNYSVNGLNAYQAEATAATQDGGNLTVNVHSISYGGNLYRILSYTNTSTYNNYKASFQTIPNGFNSVTDASILNIKPVRLNLVQTTRTGSFSSFLPSNLPMEIDPRDLAIVNQVDLSETIPQGRWIKIPVQ